MIEDMFDDEIGFISARRLYECPLDGEHVTVTASLRWFQRIRGPLHLPDVCAACHREPVLWDHWRQQPYVLVPFVIAEEPW